MLRFQTLPKTKMLVLVLAVAYMFILPPSQVAAQGIDVDPLSWDFGDVQLGTLETKTFRISLSEPVPLTVYSVQFTAGSSPAFSFEEFLLDGTTPIAGIPPELLLYSFEPDPVGFADFLDVTVGFCPDSLGLHTASIRIDGDAEPPDDTLFLPLSGAAVPIPVPSSTLLVCIGLAGLAGIRRRFRGQ